MSRQRAGRIYAFIRDALIAEQPAVVAAETGVSYQLITRVRAGSRTGMRLSTAEKLLEYFEKRGVTPWN